MSEEKRSSERGREPIIHLPISMEFAMRLVATSLIVLWDAPEDRMVAVRHALWVNREGKPFEQEDKKEVVF